MILADRIRHFVTERKIIPAREQGLSIITLSAGEIHTGMKLTNRMPAVCGALDAEKFLAMAGVRLLERRGPVQGKQAEWVIALC